MGVATGSFLLFAASQVATPGPANMALLTTGARYGLRAAMPFVLGVVAGKQLVIWPVGFGLMGLATKVPWVFEILKWASAAYICWLAWRVAHLRLAPGTAEEKAPGFWAGLLVHPLNPKAWAMITAGFTAFVSPGTPALQATATIAICLCMCQLVFHPIWTWGGEKIAARVAGTPAERYLMGTLAALTVASVLFVLFGGGTA
ncbi:LysE family translocator [Pseudoruegeria sp. SHC-113]|uniref:LysE family translocator n=1 Tax=Pseudoruegeria sp. SHC-113 TaxID=2855439 RepID=UPI0021BA6961|nr:LysE family translocator [Pseudoruegeria sp. SHC-113]MCT8160380.1 LysE family translocator [Pseudoruegeria sp. SHC-113]